MQTLALVALVALLGTVAGGTVSLADDVSEGVSEGDLAALGEVRRAFGRGSCGGLRDQDGDGIPNIADEDFVPFRDRDHDGDGIPNREDEDFPRPGNGEFVPPRLRDDDGDGILNGQDDDWVPQRHGDGFRPRRCRA